MARRAEFYYDGTYYRKRVKLKSGVWKDVRAKSKEELRKKLYDLETAQRMGIVLDDKTTVAELAAQWFNNRKDKWSYSRKEDYVNAINVHICPYIGGMLVKEVKPEHCQMVLSKMAHLSNSMQSKTVTTLKQIFECAEENGLIFRSPCSKLKAAGERSKEKTPLTPEQSKALLEATKGTRAYLFIMLGLYAGLRREEICGLRWVDVDLTGNPPHLTVNNAVRFEGTKAVFPSPLKTRAAHRTIPLPAALAAALAEAKKQTKSVFVVPSANGGVATPQSVRNLMKIVDRRRASNVVSLNQEDQKQPRGPKIKRTLDFKVTPHLLRHTYLTRLCESGLDVKKCQYLAGHADIKVTLGIYCHVTNNRPEQLIEAVEKAFTG